MKRWVCPRCGEGKLAPAAMRRDDARLYCLGCTGSTGKLVQRVCPAREQQAARRAEAKRDTRIAREARKRLREAERAKERDPRAEREKWLRSASVQWCKLEAWGQRLAVDELVIRHRRDSRHTSGNCAPWSRRIVLTVGEYDSTGGASVLLHEIAHLAPRDKDAGRRTRWHGPMFWARLRWATEEITGVDYGPDGRDAQCEEVLYAWLMGPRRKEASE